MRKFWQNNTINQENNGELENQSRKLQQESRELQQESRELQQESRELQQSLAELDCENTIIKEKEQFGRVRKSVMNVLRAKYGEDVANRALSRVNKRIQTNSFTIRNS